MISFCFFLMGHHNFFSLCFSVTNIFTILIYVSAIFTSARDPLLLLPPFQWDIHVTHLLAALPSCSPTHRAPLCFGWLVLLLQPNSQFTRATTAVTATVLVWVLWWVGSPWLSRGAAGLRECCCYNLLLGCGRSPPCSSWGVQPPATTRWGATCTRTQTSLPVNRLVMAATRHSTKQTPNRTGATSVGPVLISSLRCRLFLILFLLCFFVIACDFFFSSRGILQYLCSFLWQVSEFLFRLITNCIACFSPNPAVFCLLFPLLFRHWLHFCFTAVSQYTWLPELRFCGFYLVVTVVLLLQ